MKIAIVEDDQLAGKVIEDYLKEQGNIEVIRYRNGVNVINSIYTGKDVPDVILMDINLPDVSGIELTRMIKERYPEINIIMQTVVEEPEKILDAIKAGASGYILKTSHMKEILIAIEMIQAGGSFLTGKIAKKILNEFQEMSNKLNPSNVNNAFNLTQREKEILTELVKGASYKEIGTKEGISPNTVANHVRSIYKKLHVKSKGEAISKFTQSKSGA